MIIKIRKVKKLRRKINSAYIIDQTPAIFYIAGRRWQPLWFCFFENGREDWLCKTLGLIHSEAADRILVISRSRRGISTCEMASISGAALLQTVQNGCCNRPDRSCLRRQWMENERTENFGIGRAEIEFLLLAPQNAEENCWLATERYIFFQPQVRDAPRYIHTQHIQFGWKTLEWNLCYNSQWHAMPELRKNARSRVLHSLAYKLLDLL